MRWLAVLAALAAIGMMGASEPAHQAAEAGPQDKPSAHQSQGQPAKAAPQTDRPQAVTKAKDRARATDTNSGDAPKDDPDGLKTTDVIVAWSAAASAVFALVLAFFTYRLIVVGRDQHKAAMGAVALAREEFLATHRPRIIVRDVNVIGGDAPQILYLLVNTGGSQATICESWVMCEFVDPEYPPRNMTSAGHRDLGALKLGTGEPSYQTYDPAPDVSTFLRLGRAASLFKVDERGHPRLHFAGAILYWDANGNLRRSVFRRAYDLATGKFRRLDDPDYEYSD